MRFNSITRRVSYVFLCLLPFLLLPLVGVRALRIAGVYQTAGAVLFAVIVSAAWLLGVRAIKGAEGRTRLALAGTLLLLPWTLFALLWIGLASPAEATPEENRMRFLVLAAGSIAVTGGFVVLKEALHEAGERVYSTLGSAANMLAGAAYLVWLSFTLGVVVVRVQADQIPPAVKAVYEVYDILLFFACILMYLTTAAFATSLGRARWLGRGATRAYLIASCLALLFLVLRGFSYPDLTASSTPWYLRPAFIAGIPAVPWIMPFLLGVVLVRRAGDESTEATVADRPDSRL
jgi:hypothetical protein